MHKILWATTFSADMWETSASRLISTFVEHKIPGKLVAFPEGMDLPEAYSNVEATRLDGDAFLTKFLEVNSAVIPADLGGVAKAPLCKCSPKPLDVHSSRHKLPCVGYWFCRNAFRWLRKVRAAQLAAHMHSISHDIMMWVDSDAFFKKALTEKTVASWFANKYGCVYLKSRRAAIETGVVGYHLKLGGIKIIDKMIERYENGKFRKDRRWDDCVQLEKAISNSSVKAVDLAANVGENSTVIQFSPLGEYLGHDKGLHRRKRVLT